jgi:Putative transposase, YhgA-like
LQYKIQHNEYQHTPHHHIFIKMNIANPIYDTVFKYLMEDLDIAKGLLSTILKQEIVDLDFYPQESIAENDLIDKPLRVYRIDFAAVIQEPSGQVKKVLIELQKTRRSTNILRFRRYLAENYQKEETITQNGEEVKQSLEIVTIYFLGFNLDDVDTPVLHVKNCFTDATTGETLEQAKREEFVRLLNHESYMIQIRKLKSPTRSHIERILNVFNQTYKIKDDDHILNFANEMQDPLLNKMINRLTRAIADTEMRKKMDLEDEIEREYQSLESQINAQKKALEDKDKALEDKDKALEDKDKALEDKDKQIEALLKELANKKSS